MSSDYLNIQEKNQFWVRWVAAAKWIAWRSLFLAWIGAVTLVFIHNPLPIALSLSALISGAGGLLGAGIMALVYSYENI